MSNASTEDSGSANDASTGCLDVPQNFLTKHHLTRHTPNLEANCLRLFQGHIQEVHSARARSRSWENAIGDNEFLAPLTVRTKASNALANAFYLSQKEKDFPLAFVMLFHYKPGIVQQYFRLLKFLYRPQNVFCIHIDAKAPTWWTSKIKQFASFFPNILLAENPVEVQYSTASILEAHLRCFRELSQPGLNWKYAINLHSTELPLVTNREIVETLEQAGGRNLITTGVRINNLSDHSIDKRRVQYKCEWNGKTCKITSNRKTPPPFTFELYKGADSANGALSRDFVRFILTDARAKTLKLFLQDVRSAVELFFNTLNQLDDAPGGVSAIPLNLTLPQVTVRFWKLNHLPGFCSAQKYVHGVCIADVGDLPKLKTGSEQRTWLFYNKYILEYDHIVMDCMEDLLIHRNHKEYNHDCH